MRLTLLPPAFFACLGMAGCDNGLPSVETISPEARNAPYTKLVQLEPLFEDAKRGSRISQAGPNLTSRIARLRARANALRGKPVIQGQARLRLLNASKNRRL